MTFDDWLAIGREHGFCSSSACSTHDGIPMSDRELDMWDDGDDPCIHVLRLYEDEKTMTEVEKNILKYRA
jgi:hypothetical protein